MLVNEYAQKVISERQYKYQTRQSYVKGIKAIGIWDMEVASLSPQLFYEKLDSYQCHLSRTIVQYAGNSCNYFFLYPTGHFGVMPDTFFVVLPLTQVIVILLLKPAVLDFGSIYGLSATYFSAWAIKSR